MKEAFVSRCSCEDSLSLERQLLRFKTAFKEMDRMSDGSYIMRRVAVARLEELMSEGRDFKW